jgi:tetratricopeptide (TPR) repeat protein
MNFNFMQTIRLVFLMLVLGFSTVYADNGTSKIQLIKIKNTMAGGDYVSAWRELRKLEKTDTITSELYFLSGECNFHLKNYEDALERLKRSIALDANDNPEKYFLTGKIFQLTGELEKAIIEYQTFNQKSPKKSEETEEANVLIAQCKKSIEIISKPINVKISNIGTSINSEYPEYNPSISADGKTMIFTSRRPESTGKLTDPEDGKFYEDIYISKKDSLTGKWLEAENIPGAINEDNHDANMTLSPDGKQIFVYRNKGMRGSGTLFVSKISNNGKWKKAEELEGDINTSYFESSACLSPDGKTLYFVSERPRGGMGMGDIYMAKKKSKTEWDKAVSLGPIVNDEYDQIGLFMHPDGKTLYYASNSPKSLGGYDIFKTTIENGICSEPENLGYPINTIGDERFFCLSTDGRQAWFSSDRSGGKGDIDIWEIDFSAIVQESKVKTSSEQEVQVPKGPPISILKGHIIDSDASQIVETEVIVSDKENGKTFNINSDENGDYFITLEGDRTYVIEVKNPLYKPYRFEVPMKSLIEGTFTKEQLIVLDRLKK